MGPCVRVYAHSGVSEDGKSMVRTFQFSGALQAVVVVPDFQVSYPRTHAHTHTHTHTHTRMYIDVHLDAKDKVKSP